MEKKVNYAVPLEPAGQRGYPDKSSKSKVSSKSELCKVKQDNNLSSTHNASSDKDSYGKHVSLEETIRKIIQIEFENYLPYIIQQAKKCVPASAQDSDEEDILDGPMEINFIRKKEPATDVVTVKCKIKRLVIPAGTVDPGANFPIMSEDIFEQSKLEIDTKEKYDLRGIATIPIESLGTVRNVPVNFAPGCTIYADFAVVKYPKLMLILPNTLLDKYNYDLLASKRELRLECNVFVRFLFGIIDIFSVDSLPGWLSDDLRPFVYERSLEDKVMELDKSFARENILEALQELLLWDEMVSRSQTDILPDQSIHSRPANFENFISREGVAKQLGGAEVVPSPQVMPLASSSRIAPAIPAVESSLMTYVILTLFLFAVIWIVGKKIWNSWKKINTEYSSNWNYFLSSPDISKAGLYDRRPEVRR
ncbi:hypothetical protein RhiirC2_721090 [Rhizophagus irregularis]|uniref:Uncharacterized protein n=1 Tax=Rhizophagus irregularis TaxID=588596 RepID=A0A2N1M7N8_9GLOM|nr:hypothetical protein RhiirC2_721090 [Rhizophagus irregularis]